MFKIPITGKHIRLEEDKWIYPSRVSSLSEADLLAAEEYIVSRKGMIAEYAENSDIYQKCLQTEGLNNNNRKIMWWTQNIVKSNEAEISYMESDPVLQVLE